MSNTEFGDDDGFDLDAALQRVKSAADLPEFLRLLNKEIITNDPEFSDRFLSDAYEGAAMWIEASEPPDKLDWQYVASLFVGAVYYN